MVLFFVILALVFVLVLVIVSNIVIVPQSKVYVIERLGSYSETWPAGLHVKIPFIERIAKKVSLKEHCQTAKSSAVTFQKNARACSARLSSRWTRHC